MSGVIVIGVGGTGVKTLIHVKKQLIDRSQAGELPSNVKLLGVDTLTTPETVAGIGGAQATARKENDLGYDGLVKLTLNHDYIHIGGQTKNWVCGGMIGEPGWPRDYFARDWFNQRFFCNHPDSETLMNLIDGAGQFRQLGRLAILNALRQGRNSNLYKMLAGMIASPGMGNHIDLIVCGSLAGGTGASMYIDIAHLVKMICKHNGKNISSYGMLAMPGAFQYTKPGLVTVDMHARTTAGLRELSRFLTVNDDQLGFDMKYIEGDDPILVSKTRGAIFKIVYLFGERGKLNGQNNVANPLNVKIEYGVAPSIATWIQTLIDPLTSERFKGDLANRDHALGTKTIAGRTPAYVGTTGSYSYVLPIASIAENFSAKLCLEVLNDLVPITEDGKVDATKRGGVKGVDARSTAIEVLVGNNKYPILKDIGKEGAKYKENAPNAEKMVLRNNVIDRKVEAWKEKLLPLQADQKYFDLFAEMDEKETYFYNEDASFLRDPLKGALVQEESKRNHGNNSKIAAEELAQNCDNEEQRKLSSWGLVLSEVMQEQLKDFQLLVKDIVVSTLNGELEDIPGNATQNRCGKLGWLNQFVSIWAGFLDNTRLLLQESLLAAENDFVERERGIDINRDGQIILAMKLNAKKQKDYLKERQFVFNYHRWKLLCEAELDVVLQMQDYIKYLRSQLENYISMLQGSRTSLRTELATRIDNINSNRDDADESMIKVREFVEDTAWESAQYAEYIKADEKGVTTKQKVLKNIFWSIKDATLYERQNDHTEISRTVLNLELHLDGFDLQPNTIFDSTKIPTWNSDEVADKEKESLVNTNAERFMARTRKSFHRVWDEMTIIDYLTDKYDGSSQQTTPETFAKELIGKCGPLLNLPEKGGHETWTYLLLPKPKDAPAGLWINSVYNHIFRTTLSTQGYGGEFLHTDPTTLTFLVISDFIKVNDLSEYAAGIATYHAMPVNSVGTQTSKSLTHVFPAEQNVVGYDKRNTDGIHHIISPRVTAVLDNKRFQLFVQSLALGLIIDDKSIEDQEVKGNIKQIVIPPRPGEENEYGGLITDPFTMILNDAIYFPSDEVQYLPAAETFCLRELEFSDQEYRIDDLLDRLREHINNVAENLVQKYLPSWEKGEGTKSGITAAALPESEKRQAELRAAVFSKKYQDLAGYLNTEVKPILGKNITDDFAKMTIEDEKDFIGVILAYCKTQIR